MMCMEINESRNEITTCYVAPKWLALFNQMENFKLKTMNLFIINHDPYDPSYAYILVNDKVRVCDNHSCIQLDKKTIYILKGITWNMIKLESIWKYF